MASVQERERGKDTNIEAALMNELHGTGTSAGRNEGVESVSLRVVADSTHGHGRSRGRR